jgi:hypothetical protein
VDVGVWSEGFQGVLEEWCNDYQLAVPNIAMKVGGCGSELGSVIIHICPVCITDQMLVSF